MMKHTLEQPGLAKLFQQAQLVDALHQLALGELPAPMAAHLMGVSIEQQCLICLVDNQAWSSKIRFFEQNLLRCFQKNLPHLKLNQVQFKLIFDFQTPPTKPRKANRPDMKSAQEMQAISQQLPDKVAHALTRLSQRAFDTSID